MNAHTVLPGDPVRTDARQTVPPLTPFGGLHLHILHFIGAPLLADLLLLALAFILLPACRCGRLLGSCQFVSLRLHALLPLVHQLSQAPLTCLAALAHGLVHGVADAVVQAVQLACRGRVGAVAASFVDERLYARIRVDDGSGGGMDVGCLLCQGWGCGSGGGRGRRGEGCGRGGVVADGGEGRGLA